MGQQLPSRHLRQSCIEGLRLMRSRSQLLSDDPGHRRPAIFIDRDGTLIEDLGYLSAPDKVVLLPRVAAGVRTLAAHGFRIFAITNQSGIGRGYFTLAEAEATNAKVASLLEGEGAAISAWYICPHAPSERCGCRKPLPGLVDQAVGEFATDLSSSYVVGDKDSDILLAPARGMHGILVRTGYGNNFAGWARGAGFGVCDDLENAAARIIADMVPSHI